MPSSPCLGRRHAARRRRCVWEPRLARARRRCTVGGRDSRAGPADETSAGLPELRAFRNSSQRNVAYGLEVSASRSARPARGRARWPPWLEASTPAAERAIRGQQHAWPRARARAELGLLFDEPRRTRREAAPLMREEIPRCSSGSASRRLRHARSGRGLASLDRIVSGPTADRAAWPPTTTSGRRESSSPLHGRGDAVRRRRRRRRPWQGGGGARARRHRACPRATNAGPASSPSGTRRARRPAGGDGRRRTSSVGVPRRDTEYTFATPLGEIFVARRRCAGAAQAGERRLATRRRGVARVHASDFPTEHMSPPSFAPNHPRMGALRGHHGAHGAARLRDAPADPGRFDSLSSRHPRSSTTWRAARRRDARLPARHRARCGGERDATRCSAASRHKRREGAPCCTRARAPPARRRTRGCPRALRRCSTCQECGASRPRGSPTRTSERRQRLAAQAVGALAPFGTAARPTIRRERRPHEIAAALAASTGAGAGRLRARPSRAETMANRRARGLFETGAPGRRSSATSRDDEEHCSRSGVGITRTLGSGRSAALLAVVGDGCRSRRDRARRIPRARRRAAMTGTRDDRFPRATCESRWASSTSGTANSRLSEPLHRAYHDGPRSPSPAYLQRSRGSTATGRPRSAALPTPRARSYGRAGRRAACVNSRCCTGQRRT